MSPSIAIPAGPSSAMSIDDCPSSKAPMSSSLSSYSTSPRTPAQSSSAKDSKPPSSDKKKMAHERRPSLLSSAILKQECTVINVGDPDGPPRLISYLSSSQGFDWNPEIFLPSYMEYEYTPLENKREPVIDIILTDEEIKNMFPQ